MRYDERVDEVVDVDVLEQCFVWTAGFSWRFTVKAKVRTGTSLFFESL